MYGILQLKEKIDRDRKKRRKKEKALRAGDRKVGPSAAA